MNYQQFLASKQRTVEESGFAIGRNALNPALFEWQKDIVLWALKKGKAALFEDCGMGKTPQQLEWAQKVSEHEGRPVLILAPLAVSEQTKREGMKFGIEVTVCRSQVDVRPGVNITNYEMLAHFDPSAFAGVVLDESSILKAFMGKTKRALVEAFADTPYKLACTATPAPNDLMELLNHAEYLGVMRSSEALSCWFIADQSGSGVYRLKGHAEKDFWRWVTTWAVCLDKPSDIGHSDEGYILPPLVEEDRIVEINEFAEDLGHGMFRKIDTSATGFYREKRVTLEARVRECVAVATASDDPCVIWCTMNEESAALKRLLPDAVEVRGSDSPAFKETAAMDFIEGRKKILISKPSIFGFGLNFQHCQRAIFCGMDYSFEGYYQAVRRFYRFGQRLPVHACRVIGSTERAILDAQQRKQAQQRQMHSSMAMAMQAFQGDSIRGRRFKLDLAPQNTSIPLWMRSEAS